MSKVFWYELRRAVCGKFFLGLLAVCAFFSWQTLTTDVIQGVAHTAPFSPWSFGYYLARVAPLLSVALLFFLRGLFVGEAGAVQVLAQATPVSSRSYLMTRLWAVAAAWLVLALCVIALGAGFMVSLFGPAVYLWALIAPSLTVLLPTLIFTLGLGLVASRAHPALIFVLMAGLLAIGLLPLPSPLDLFGAGFFSGYPLTLGALDPAFALPWQVALGRAAYFLAGCAALFAAGKKPAVGG